MERVLEKPKFSGWCGFTRSMPILLGYLPVGIAFGLLATDIGIPPLLTVLMSLFVLGAASQIVAIQLISIGADFWLIIVTTLVINLRHMLMASYLAPYLKDWHWSEISIFSFGLTDEAFALHSARVAEGDLDKTEAITINVMSLVSWVLSTALGVLIGPLLLRHQVIALEFALPAMFIVLLVLLVKSQRMLAIAVLASGLAVMAKLIGFTHWGVLAATFVAATIGLGIEKWKTTN